MDQTSETEKVYQRNKYNEIIEILLTAGYFRARINTLSEFDKVVGGLCWCITSSGEIVDVDILFQENSTIGQKIALSEAIVKALRKMGCKCPLQPHQIQGGVGGSDYAALHQVIVWLVKKYFERRGEREQQLRSYSTFQFSKNYQLPTEGHSNDLSECLSRILNRTKAVRSYKRKDFSGESEETRVRACLLEFGESFAKAAGASTQGGGRKRSPSTGGASESAPVSFESELAGKMAAKGAKGSSGEASVLGLAAASVKAARGEGGHGSGSGQGGGGGTGPVAAAAVLDGDRKVFHVTMSDSVEVTLAGLSKLDATELSGFEKQLAKAARDARKEEQLFAEEASKVETELMKQMSQIDEDAATAVSGSQVGNIVGLGSDEIGSALAAYQAEIEESKKQLDQNLASGKMGAAAAFTRQRQNLLKQQSEVDTRAVEVKVSYDAMDEKLRLIEEERESSVEYIEQLKAQLKKLGEMENAATQQEELTILKGLVSLNESLKAQEMAFKGSCKAQMQDYQERIKACDAEETEDSDENRKLNDIEDMHAKVSAKYNKLRQLLAETNLEVANAVRTIDDIPTRTELIQYERRFVELYSQVAWKLEETRKYYGMYNTLDTTLSFLQKEVKLLNSISENFTEAMKSSQSKIEFSKQFEGIVKGVEDTLRRQENILGTHDKQVEDLKSTHQQLVDEQRKYFKAVKDFQEECNKNDWLSSKLEQLTHQ